MIESITSLFIVGGTLTLWFWLLTVIASVIIIACVEHEHYPTPSIVAIILAILFWKYIIASWQITALVIAVFAVAGAIWSTFQWFRRVNTKARYYREKYGDTLTDMQMHELKEEVSASRHKALITWWIAFWIWDMFWTLTGDFFNMIYDALAGVYQNISNRAIGKFSVAAKTPHPKTDNEDPNYTPRRSRPGSY
jgi:hypothetical protein